LSKADPVSAMKRTHSLAPQFRWEGILA
jgi:hypothetical protein